MENEIAATHTLLSAGIGILALALAMMAPMGLSLSAMGSGRFRHRFTNLGNSVLLFPFVFVNAYIFGWMFSFAFSSGPGFTGGFQSAWHAVPWANVLGPGYHQTGTGTFALDNMGFIRFTAMAWLGSAILAGAVMERIKLGGLLLLTSLMTSFCFALAVGWGWSENGWMVALMGYHDPIGVTTVATLVGGFTLGVLRVLGPRIASQDDTGKVHQIAPQSPGLVLTGHLLFLLGVIGLSVAAVDMVTPLQLAGAVEYVSTNAYGAPTDPTGVLLNLLAAIAGGLMIGTILTHADICKSVKLTLASIVGTLPMADFFNPLQTLLLAMFLAWACGSAQTWLERKFGLDDIIGGVALFGFAGFWGLVISGVLLWGTPTSVNPDYVHINPFGNTTAAMILFWILGYIPGYIAARVLRYAGGLRQGRVVELVGGDLDLLREAEKSTFAAFQREDRHVCEHLAERT